MFKFVRTRTINSFKKEIADLKKDVENKAKEIEWNEDSLLTIKRLNKEIKAKLDDATAKNSQTITSITNERDELIESLAKLVKDNNLRVRTLESVINERDEAKASLLKSEDRNSKLSEQVEKLENKLTKSISDYNRILKENSVLTDEVKDLKKLNSEIAEGKLASLNELKEAVEESKKCLNNYKGKKPDQVVKALKMLDTIK